MGKIREDAANGGGVSFFASAHQTTNFRTYEASLKRVAKDKGALLKRVVKRISATEDLWEMQQAAEELPGIGVFFGWQLLCDLEESRCLKFDDSFCELGPRAKGKSTIQVVLKLGSFVHSRTFRCSQTFMFQMASRLSFQ
jgi:hypothetical protein